MSRKRKRGRKPAKQRGRKASQRPAQKSRFVESTGYMRLRWLELGIRILIRLWDPPDGPWWPF